MLWNAFLLALREIRRNMLRSVLTILGIVIGVAAVIVMVTLGGGATRQVTSQIESLGSNLLMIRVGQHMGPGQSSSAPLLQPGGCPGDPARYPGCAGGRALRQHLHHGHRRQQQLVDRRDRDRQRLFRRA